MDWFISEALACPVCYAADSRSVSAYLLITIALIVLPLVIGTVLFIHLRHLLKNKCKN